MKSSKLFVLCLLTSLLVVLAACGSPQPASDDQQPTATTGSAEPAATAEPTDPPPTATSTQAPPTATTAAEPTATPAATEAAPDDVSPTPEPETIGAGDPVAGEAHFNQVCVACHGPGGEGIEGLGKDLTTSDFVAGLSDEELVAFIQEGRPADHPDNTTGVAMPPRGGNPNLTDAQLLDIVAYIRTLQE